MHYLFYKADATAEPQQNSVKFIFKKLNTSEEGGAHLRIAFWHLLMNFEKSEKSESRKNEKNCWLYNHFTHVYQKTTIIWGTAPEIRSEISFFVILGHFLPFHLP